MHCLREAVGSGDESRDLLDLYVNLTRADLERLGTAVDMRDATRIAALAHSCAGSSATCGIVHLAGMLRTMEAMGRNDDLTVAAPLAAAIQSEFTRVTLRLQQYQLGDREASADECTSAAT